MSRSVVLPVEAEIDEDGHYFVRCPLLQGCHAQGDTLAEALSRLEDVASSVLEYMAELHIELPAGLAPLADRPLREEIVISLPA